MQWLCRDCPEYGFEAAPARCPACASPRLVRHTELHSPAIAHIDCDAFYASVEKRNRPELASKPVIIGGSRRGVVATACYVARMSGVRSAMPMYEALERCPDAVVIRPDMQLYAAEGRIIRDMMMATGGVVQPVSIDEAWIDLRGIEAQSGVSAAVLLAALVRDIAQACGLSVSVGLSWNRFLAKLASDMDKPRGFTVIGEAETLDLIAPMPVKRIPGVGPVTARKLTGLGIRTIGQLRQIPREDLKARFGSHGEKLWHLARGEGSTEIRPDRETRSVSGETTFSSDINSLAGLEQKLWPVAQKVAERLARKQLAGRTVTLKLRRDDFRTFTRAESRAGRISDADDIFARARSLLAELLREHPHQRWRLIGAAVSGFHDEANAAGRSDATAPPLPGLDTDQAAEDQGPHSGRGTDSSD